MKEIAEALGRGLEAFWTKSIPAQESGAYFGWMNGFVSLDLVGSSETTRKKLGWKPTGPSLISDLDKMAYAAYGAALRRNTSTYSSHKRRKITWVTLSHQIASSQSLCWASARSVAYSPISLPVAGSPCNGHRASGFHPSSTKVPGTTASVLKTGERADVRIADALDEQTAYDLE